MSDKSFGDHLKRNVVKNPLLSTAVTGLSIEDLTHNAVLLPAAPSQELITSHGQQSGSQIETLENATRKNDNHPSGDANSNILHTSIPPTDIFNTLNNQNNASKQKSTVSKALPKSDDDFDVNEYFARLQGTRYVSAPLNSLLKEDKKSTLEATEENLEEINLNEPERGQEVVDVHQSLTADIAQNFSQLPTVLPQVASAVFSSFSNMLNMKSREQTPAVAVSKPVSHEVEPSRMEAVGVPLMGVDEPVTQKEVGPPPTELRVGGTTNYRITTKKKAYAQIPGLSSTNTTPAYMPMNPAPVNFPLDTQPDLVDQQSHIDIGGISKSADIITNLVPAQTNLDAIETRNDLKPPTREYNLFNPHDVPDNTHLVNEKSGVDINVYNPTIEVEPKVVDETNIFDDKQSNLFTTVEQIQGQQSHGANNVPIIPPPPMFSNVPKKDSQTNVKSVLPPSVARRIGSHHPIIKPQMFPPTLQSKDNIFIPAAVPDQAPKTIVSDMTNTPFYRETNLQPLYDSIPSASVGSAFVQFNTTPATTESTLQHMPVVMPVASSSATPATFKPETSLEYNLAIQPAINPIFPTNILSSEAAAPPPMFFNPDNLTKPPSESTPASFLSDENKQENISSMPLPTAFFNPNATTQSSIDNKDTSQVNILSHSYDQNIAEAVKAIPEPPKLSGNLNYRMQKKRPQYYSGPIEGVGAISNNVKPTIPTLESSAFKGSLFTPEMNQNTVQQPVSNVNPAIISQQSITPPTFAQFEVNTPQMPSYVGTDYNTAFDMSRHTTDNYEIPKQEATGFGIIGSLKSKLSSLDINKIQSTVTTFFDPAYNDIKKENTNIQGLSTYDNTISYGPNRIQDSHLEVFVQNAEHTKPTLNQSCGQYNYQHPYNYGGQANQYYQNQSYDSGNLGQTYTTPDLVSTYNQNTLAPHNYGSPSSNLYDPGHAVDIQTTTDVFPSNNITSMNIPTIPQTLDKTVSRKSTQVVSNSADKLNEANLSSTDKPLPAIGDEIKTDMASFFGLKNESNTFELDSNEPKDTAAFVVSHQLFNLSQPIETEDLNKKLENLQIAREKEAAVSHSKDVRSEILSNISDISAAMDCQTNTQPVKFFTNFPTQDSRDAGYLHSVTNSGYGSSYFQSGNDYKDTLKKEQENSNDIPRIDSTAMPLFGLPNVLGDIPIVNVGSEVKSVSLFGAVEENQSDSNISEILTANTANQNKIIANDGEVISDFNICETCREVTVPEDKGEDDLTAHLIENVTAPIQLLNPVIALLSESNANNDEADFEPNQCAEFSHITEETIETIQVQTATELLDDEDEVRNVNAINYGWNTTNSNTSFHPTEALLEHDFNFKIDPNAIGFFSNNSLFFEDMPNNASDEIKAEFKSTHEESPLIVPNIPTAPPAEDDDTKSDETGGLDVHSIEQDAKMDFPIYEEFVIEPSETDDDKIEYRERERSSEDPVQDVDTFTNRVERFKKMEETVDKADNVLNVRKNTIFDMNTPISPAMTIASYFDTGNYAAETHYRNSISSPTSIFNVGSPNAPMRIPPGFEEEYRRRMSVLSSRSQDRKSDKDENIRYIPETSTQTKPVVTTTYSMMSNKQLDITVTSTIQSVTRTQEIPRMDLGNVTNLNPPIPEIMTLKDNTSVIAKPLNFSSVLDPNPESGDNLASSLFTDIGKEPKILFESKPDDKKETDKTKNLADPLTFFSSNDETPSVAADNNFNRLASYFTSPPKTDHGKSFFELSQSQNHYRHANYDTNSTHDDKLYDIPNDVYLKNLMRDLTSSSNLSVNPADQIVRTVNYFTIEFDNDNEIKTALNISEPDLKKLDKENVVNDKCDSEYEESNMSDDKKIMTVVSKCKFCCNNDYFNNVITLNKVALDTTFKVKTFMDNTDGRTDNGTDKKVDMDKSNEDRGREVAVTFDSHEESAGVATATESRTASEYIPVKHHWFYRVDVEGKSIWRGFSATDSGALEDAFMSPDLDERTVVATDGGRFDVNIVGRLRTSVYWAEKPTNVRRCSWFYKGTTDARYVPYTEAIAEKLEEEYRRGITSGQWHRRLVLPSNSLVVMHGPAVMVHLTHQDPPTPEASSRPRVVRRGCEECEVEDAEPSRVDHLLLLCHGVGSACDMRFRSLQEVVDDFRATSLQLLQGHYRNSYEKGVVNRVEVLPISWHESLHSGETGVDRRLADITLDSIPRLRAFTNDTVLDVLFYTSPVFCQTIIDTVCAELNRVYALFMSRMPGFRGRVSVGGHSLGSVILYDLLCHQHPETPDSPECVKSYVEGAAGTGQGAVRYPSLTFRPDTLYALGSPIAMFECIRGVKSLGTDFKLPTCKNFFNIFHPYDPIAYRIEPLINTQLGSVKPFLIPHHKGRKRMHLELKDTMARVGADIKQKLLESLKSTWSNMWKTQPPHDAQLEKVVEEEMEKEHLCGENKNDATQSDVQATPELLGNLNAGRRIDYVLQETPLEMINEYLFAMSSHVCYWESEDTMLLILREIYDSIGVSPDSTVPQQSMTVQRQRPARPNETYVVNASEYPSTSRDGT